MSTAIEKRENDQALVADAAASEIVERLVVGGDLSKLTPAERVTYYNGLCRSLGLNPLTQPFGYLTLSGKLTLYAKKDATEQLRRRNGVSIFGLDERQDGDLFVVVAHARTPDGREDMDMGAVSIKGKSGDDLANARMKATTKAKRRVTLSICGLGFLDETEIETVAGARVVTERQLAGGPVPAQPDARVWHEAQTPADEGQSARQKPSAEKVLAVTHRRIRELRKQIMEEGAENEATLNEMLGQYGCETVEELTIEQAAEYGKALKDIHEQFVANTVDGAIEGDPAF